MTCLIQHMEQNLDRLRERYADYEVSTEYQKQTKVIKSRTKTLEKIWK